MKKILTMKQLESQYSGEWVLLVNPVHDKLMEPIRGELVFHSRDRDEVYKEAHKRKDAHTAIFYVGKLPEDLVVVLLNTHLIQRLGLSLSKLARWGLKDGQTCKMKSKDAAALLPRAIAKEGISL